MKFLYIKIPVTIQEPGILLEDTPQTLDIRMVVANDCSHEEAARTFSAKLSDKLGLVDLGDEE